MNTQHFFFAFLNTNNNISEREFKQTIAFTTESKRLKYLGINLTKKGERSVH